MTGSALHPRNRIALLQGISQPRSVSQLASHLAMKRDRCSQMMRRARKTGLVVCVNSQSSRTRVYAPTAEGLMVLHSQALPLASGPMDDWRDFAFVASSHRRAVVLAMEGPMQAAAIKRRARYLDPTVRMSANNVRDVLGALLTQDIVREVWLRKRAHRRFELTAKGIRLQEQLRRAETTSR